jgi:protein O-GlcNAc transferase
LRSKDSLDRYREDLFSAGQVGAKCRFDAHKFRAQGDHKSPLQSWYSELQQFEQFQESPKCDLTIWEPTILIKLDAGVNMYHHFCDFVNLYVTQHFNNTFSQSITIVFWDTSSSDYWSYFSDMWSVFSHRKPIHLREFDGKKVCFKNVIFSFLARMRFGLFYNMPLVQGCHSTALFRAFSQHVIHRFQIEQSLPQSSSSRPKLRVTFLSRGTQYRNILNEKAIISHLKEKFKSSIVLTHVTYDMSTSFVDQLRHTHNTDIFMSMHGAGLTHLLFLPDWASLFEIYNCEDNDCYHDLARLRGVKYFTWEREDKMTAQDQGKHPQMGTPHKKFTNYSFDLK